MEQSIWARWGPSLACLGEGPCTCRVLPGLPLEPLRGAACSIRTLLAAWKPWVSFLWPFLCNGSPGPLPSPPRSFHPVLAPAANSNSLKPKQGQVTTKSEFLGDSARQVLWPVPLFQMRTLRPWAWRPLSDLACEPGLGCAALGAGSLFCWPESARVGAGHLPRALGLLRLDVSPQGPAAPCSGVSPGAVPWV